MSSSQLTVPAPYIKPHAYLHQLPRTLLPEGLLFRYVGQVLRCLGSDGKLISDDRQTDVACGGRHLSEKRHSYECSRSLQSSTHPDVKVGWLGEVSLPPLGLLATPQQDAIPSPRAKHSVQSHTHRVQRHSLEAHAPPWLPVRSSKQTQNKPPPDRKRGTAARRLAHAYAVSSTLRRL